MKRAVHPSIVTPVEAVCPLAAVAVTLWSPAPTLQGMSNCALNAPVAPDVSVPSTSGVDWMSTTTFVPGTNPDPLTVTLLGPVVSAAMTGIVFVTVTSAV